VDTAVAPSADAVSWINPRIRPGEQRQVVTGIPGKTGIIYTLDRATGEFLWATPSVGQNVVSNIDGATGVVTENSEVVFTRDGQEVMTCPTMQGGKDWEAVAYSPLTNHMHMPFRHTCSRLLAEAGNGWYSLIGRTQLAPGVSQVGTIQAISVEMGETIWTHGQEAFTMSLLATGGELIFGGDGNGR